MASSCMRIAIRTQVTATARVPMCKVPSKHTARPGAAVGCALLRSLCLRTGAAALIPASVIGSYATAIV